MATESSSDELSLTFARLQGMLLPEQDAIAAVAQLARAAHQVIGSATGAGVSLLEEDGTRSTTAATDTAVETVDALQYRLGQGPCLSAWATREPQRIDDTTTDPRWPRWETVAAESGIRSVLSTPLVHRGHSLGAMKVYAGEPDAFGDADGRLLGLLAEVAATLLGAAQAVEAPARLSVSLKAALASRETIGLATGVLVERHGLGPVAARTHLLELARDQGRPMARVAADVLEAERGRDR